MYTLDFDEPQLSTCECCGGTTTTLTRFVSREETPIAIYFARFSGKHVEAGVQAVVSIGEWGEDSDVSTRRAFAFSLRTKGDSYDLEVADATQSAWCDATILGTPLDSDAAVAHEWIDEARMIAEFMVTEDELVIEALATR